MVDEATQRDTEASVRVGIDVGGTFTDAVLVDGGGRMWIAKVRSRPADVATAFVEGLDEAAARAGVAVGDASYLAHGTTVATNAIVQRRLARVGLVTNRGLRDVLEIGTQQRPRVYDLWTPKPPPLVARRDAFEIGARLGPDGNEVAPVDPLEVRAVAHRLREAGVEAVAVCLLFSFVDPSHERAVANLLEEELPNMPISISCRVAPEVREYPRASTTALNAALLPLVGRYVRDLDGRARARGARVPIHLMQSNGGVSTAALTADLPIALAASGPAAGVIAAARVAAELGVEDVISFDMGGTSTDVALVAGGRPSIRFQGQYHGHVVNLPQVDVVSIGAGGGSIARVDRVGSLSVGPESAGASPGPAAYGLGGSNATVTDAHVVLGTLSPERTLAAGVRLDANLSRAALARAVATPLGISPEEAAWAVLRVVNASMSEAARLVTVARGHDPRRFALVAFGGAGPMHACALADELGVRRVIVPPFPGVAAAHGLLLSEVRHDVSRSWIRHTASVAPSELDRVLGELEQRARELLAHAGQSDGTVAFEVDMRYRGQAYNLTVPLSGRPVTRATLEALEAAFAEVHVALYDYTPRLPETELVTLRARATAPPPVVRWEAPPAAPGRSSARRVWFDGAWREVPVFERNAMPAPLRGPAIIEQEDTTTVIPAGWAAGRRAAGSIVLERQT